MFRLVVFANHDCHVVLARSFKAQVGIGNSYLIVWPKVLDRKGFATTVVTSLEPNLIRWSTASDRLTEFETIVGKGQNRALCTLNAPISFNGLFLPEKVWLPVHFDSKRIPFWNAGQRF